ncbi:MAG: glycogen debranching protein GlgX [Pseudomonadales bacterium]|nr:glycogen debranching protein GlgX [Pseudomonadales bacterium]
MQQTMAVGHYQTLGAHWDGEGINFALFSAHAKRVELCIFDSEGKHETARYTMAEQTHDIWHGYLPGLGPGTVYGYRVYGPYDPHAGHRFNHHKLLLDPYARQLTGAFTWSDAHFGYCHGDANADLSFDTRDNANFMPKCVVTAPHEAGAHGNVIGGLRKPRVPWDKTVLYETHVRGFTWRHPDLPELQRGTFAGLGHEKIIAYLKALGVSSIELLPVHSFIDEHFLYAKGLSNYWGYNTLGFFAPHTRYLSGNDIVEFRRMVEDFHEAGLEVILDVVYNHTCESNHLGPTLSFRGIDNAVYYHLQAEQPRYYVNDTGCGNTLDISHPRVLQLVMDSLRYWVSAMGVDGFRFDLAAVMGRGAHGFDQRASFFQAVAQDPVLARAKLIAEPWDIGPGGYQLGHFPNDWSEWNDNYRDTVRRFWRREPGNLPTFARRLHGSSDIFERSGRRPFASINFVTSHDGFTLHDLVSYKKRHNIDNGENNKDGHRHNLSDNFGVEGPTDDAAINAARAQQQRNFLATLMVSQGVPMLLAGDELSRTQKGNNNAYCQDNEINWLDWSPGNEDMREFVAQLTNLRTSHPILAHRHYMHPPVKGEPESARIEWLNSDGQLMREEHWQEHHNFLLGYLLTDPASEQGACYLLVIFNNTLKAQDFHLPADKHVPQWHRLLDTAQPTGVPADPAAIHGDSLQVEPRSIVILFAKRQEIIDDK